MKTAERARGKWRGILLACGVEDRFLTGKHGACPFCGGRDRFRWDNDKGSGTFICSQCGAGDGFEFLKRSNGWDFKTAAQHVDQIVGGIRPEPVRAKPDSKARADMLDRLWMSAVPLTGDDMASRYLAGRNALPTNPPKCLRFSSSCPIPSGGGHGPALLAMVVDAEGKPSTIHRTFLGPNGKADIAHSRALMPGPVPDGAAVRLFPLDGTRLGIAEGIETAMVASRRFELPVWSAINATMLGKWTAPAGLKEVIVFGDCDPAFGGQAAAYALAHRLAVRQRLVVEVCIPQELGLDWADTAASAKS